MKLALSIVVLCLCYFNYASPWIERTCLYPNTYEETVIEQASENKVSPALVMAIILAESKNHSEATSEPGAVGLMQVMPETAKWIEKERKGDPIDEELLKDPKVNISVGSWYIAHLLEIFKGNEILALAAYNAGQGHVQEWQEKEHWTESFSDVDAIPFAETREYVKKVLQYKEKYQELYSIP